MKHQVLTAALVAALLGCGDDDGAAMDAGPDAGSMMDGSMMDDGGTPPEDGGPDPLDAGTDAGMDASVDAGPLPPERDRLEVLAGETSTGYSDGVGTSARFNGAAGAVISSDGSALYVADTFNSVLRRVDVATGEVTTIAGVVQQAAAVDGTGTEARFDSPRALTITPDGSALYVFDNATIRRVALPSLEVTTVAGVWNERDYVDGVGDEARFGFLVHDFTMSADGGTLYIADRSNLVIRALDTATNEVTTLAGAPYTPSFPPQHADGTGADARMTLGGMQRVGDVIYFADTFNDCIRSYDLSTGAVTTLAGDPTMSGSMDGVGAAATFDTPQQLSADATSLYVMGFNGVLRRVQTSDFQVETILGAADDVRAVDGTGDAVRLGVSFGPSPLDATTNTLFFNDRDANAFRPVDLGTLETTTLAGALEPVGDADGSFSDARFAGPADVVCTNDASRCYLTDEGNHTIRVLDLDASTVATLAGEAGSPGADDGAFADARFAAPTGLALDEDAETLYVADSANHTLRALDLSAGTVSTLAGAAELAGSDDGVGAAAGFDGPEGLALTGDGAVLFVADQGNSVLRRVEIASASVTTVAGSAGMLGDDDGVGAAARFRSPGGLALSADEGTLYVADRSFSAAVIRAVDLSTAEVTTLAGLAGERGVADGTFAEARFGGPWDLLLSPEGDLLVSDLRNGLVRRLDLSAGTVDTWLGNVAVEGNPPTGASWPLDEATLFFPSALGRAGDDLLILAEDAVLVARPDGAW